MFQGTGWRRMVLSYWPSHRTISCTCFTESYWAGPQGDFTSKSYNFWPLSGVRYGLDRKAEAFLATSKVWSVSIWRQDKVKHPWSLWTLSADSFRCDWSLSYVSKATSNAGNGPPGLPPHPQPPKPSTVTPAFRSVSWTEKPNWVQEGLHRLVRYSLWMLPTAAGKVLGLSGSSMGKQPAQQPGIPTAGTQVPCRALSVLPAQCSSFLPVLPNYLNPVGKAKNNSLFIFS